MRFCDFFLEYKIELKKIKTLIPWTKLPVYRKIFMIITFITLPLSLIFFILKFYIGIGIFFLIFIISIISFLIIDSLPKNSKLMLDKHYSLHSKDRMNMLKKLFIKYNLDVYDTTIIDLLIAEAEEAKIEYNPFLSLKKPLKTLRAIILPIIAYVAKKLTEPATEDELLYIAMATIIIIICIASIAISLGPILNDLFYRDKQKYDYLIYDLRQLKIFKKQNNIHFS